MQNIRKHDKKNVLNLKLALLHLKYKVPAKHFSTADFFWKKCYAQRYRSDFFLVLQTSVGNV